MKPHQRWAGRGFGPDLLPIIPPNVALTGNSAVPPSQRGKVPGLRTGRGEWHGLVGWHGKQATPEDHATWDAMGAGVGLQCGRWIAVDIDVLDLAGAACMADLASRMLGAGVPRVGRAPKTVLLYAAAPGEVVTKRRIAFRLPGMSADAPPHAVEILGEGQFFVLEGIHPGTMQPYVWPEGPPASFEIVPVTAASIDGYLDAVAEAIVELGGEVVKRATAASAGMGRGDVDQAALRAPSAELLLAAAPHVPNTGGYDEWIAGIAAWKGAATGLLDDDGEALARDWTDRWTGEGAGGGGPIEFDAKWARVQPPFAAGWPQIERMARAAGWLGGVEHEFQAAGLDLAAMAREAEAAKQALAEAAAAAEEADMSLQERMFARYVWVEGVERIGDTVEKILLSRVQFNARLAEIGPPHDSRRCAWAQFLEAKHGEVRARRVADVTYRPGGPPLVEESRGLCFNTWRASSLAPRCGATDSDVRPWLDLAERVLPDARERGLLMDWLAFLIQFPGRKPPFGVVFGGEQGIGKDSLLLPIVRALGQHNVQNITVADLQGAQTYWVASAQLVIVGEMHSFARREMGDMLKPLLAAPPDTLKVNIKYLPQYAVPNILALLMFTNHLDALSIEDSDRRLLCLWSPHPNINRMGEAEAAALAASFRAYHAWRQADGGAGDAAVAGWLGTRDLTAFLRLTRAPETAAKQSMREAGRSESVAAVEDALEAMDLPDLVAPSDLATRLWVAGGKQGKPLTGQGIGRVLRALGARQVTKEAMAVPATATVAGSKRVRVWSLRNHELYSGMPDAALGRKFAEMWDATKQDIEGFFAPKDSPLPTSIPTKRPESGE